MKLRAFDPDADFDRIRNWITDERAHALWCANRFRYPLDKDDFLSVLSGMEQRTGDRFFAAVREDGKAAGFLCCSPDRGLGEGRLKFVIVDPECRGKGTAREMLRLAVSYLFENADVKRVSLTVFSENQRAKKCYEKAGFTVRKIDSPAFVYKDESWHRCGMVIDRRAASQPGRGHSKTDPGFAEQMKMKFGSSPCTDIETGFLWDQFNALFDACPAQTGECAEEELFVFKVTDAEGNLIGGCVLDMDMTKTAEFNSLWVDERYRKRGLGTALIRKAEQKAMEKGCRTVINAYTFDFQAARPLFEALGYRLIGITKDWPKGHEGYTLVKKLDGIADGQLPFNPSDQAGSDIKPGSEKDAEFIKNALEASFRSEAPRSHPYESLDRKLVDDEGRMIAGCIAGISGWDTLHIDMIWVDERYRNQGIGTGLLGVIEREAKQKGAYLARTGVIASRAAFFIKNGYTLNITHEGTPEWDDLLKRL